MFSYDDLLQVQREAAASQGNPEAVLRWLERNGFVAEDLARMAHENASAVHQMIHQFGLDADQALAALYCAAFELGVLCERKRSGRE